MQQTVDQKTLIKTEDKGIVPFDEKELRVSVESLIGDIETIEKEGFVEKAIRSIQAKDMYTTSQVSNLLILNALENIDMNQPDWTFAASRISLNRLYKKASMNRGYSKTQKYGPLYKLIEVLTNKGIYGTHLLETYSRAEIDALSLEIEPERDKLFSYIGLKTLSDRYLAKDHSGNVYELPQERWMIIAMHLMQKENPSIRLKLVREAYWALSNLYMTVATPTLANAGKSYGQLSSCFIDTVDDSLRGIYDSNTDVATLSKSGGGIGMYLGKIRSRGSDIKGFKGISSGVIPWMKQLNNTAVSVDQLGQRQGSIAVYLDLWHKDIYSFLDAKLNNGDERLRTHDLSTGVTVPDLFMERVKEKDENGRSIGKWYLFDPHEVKKVMGFSLEDSFDEEKGNGTFRERYLACVNNPELSKEEVPAIEIFKKIMKSQLETGYPYMFYRDEVNRQNPNKHAGMIYSSNLCTEIFQNMSATTVSEEVTIDGKIVITKTPGDFVVCNLSSINLGTAVPADILERLIPIQVRMLDNVIDLNTLEVLQAQLTNHKYRAVGLGTFGWHHLLAVKGIRWESEEAVDFADEIYGKIAYLTIKSSMELAKEKGAYPLFEGSEWQTGKYFERRDYDTAEWTELQKDVSLFGVRNGYMMAVAPNSSTAHIANSTPSVDPIPRKFYSVEKKNYKIPITAPELGAKTTWFYKSAYEIDQNWSIKQNAKRQRHIDQGISFNMYVKNDIKAKDFLDLHIHAWESGMKTTYYTRSTAIEALEDCESCT